MLCCWGQTRPLLPLRLCLSHYFQLCAKIKWRCSTSTLFFHRHGIHLFNINKQSSNQIQVNWTPKGHVFPTGAWPSWAVENMWAPEIHFVNGTFVVYFTGWYKHRPDQLLCVITGGSVLLWTVHRVHVGVAVSTSGSPWGPYTDPRGTFALSFE